METKQKQKTSRRPADETESDEDLYEEDDAREDEKESVNISVNSVKSKRGRKAIPDQWSRVISISSDELDNIKVYELGPDLLLSSAVRATLLRGRQPKEWKPVFWPDQYVKAGHDMTLAGNQLTKQQLVQLGQKVTQARTLQRERAAAVKNDGGAIDQDVYLRSAKGLAEKMHMGFFRQPKVENIYHKPQLTKREKWHDLSLDDKISIVHDILILKRPQQEVAKKYCRTGSYISYLVKKARKQRNLLREMMDMRDQLVVKEEVVQEVITELLAEDTFIENVQ